MGQPGESVHHSHHNSVAPPAPNDLVRYIRREERFYTPEKKGVVGLGLVRQLCHPDTCVHMELAGPEGCGYVVFVGQKGNPISY